MASPAFASPQLWAWIAIALLAAGLVYLLSPILAPFLFAAILAYILDPLVERITGRYLRRSFAVVLVLLAVLAVLAAFALIVLPLFYRELRLLGERLPDVISWGNRLLSPWLQAHFGIEFQLDVETLRRAARDLLADNQDSVGSLLGSLRVGGLAVIAF